MYFGSIDSFPTERELQDHINRDLMNALEASGIDELEMRILAAANAIQMWRKMRDTFNPSSQGNQLDKKGHSSFGFTISENPVQIG